MKSQPTIETYPELQRAFNFFNEHLFEGKLSSPLFVLESNVKSAGHFTKNKFISADGKRKTHQIALNPAMFHETGIKDNLSTMVHEMCHQYQAEHGEESRRCYHDKQWAQYMLDCGLIPSHTGLPGGKQTGQKMTHYIEENGKFDVLADQFIKQGFSFAWHDPYTIQRYRNQRNKQKHLGMVTGKKGKAAAAASSSGSTAYALTQPNTGNPEEDAFLSDHIETPNGYNSSNRIKYMCINCSQQVWGRRGLLILCGKPECNKRPFDAEEEY